MKVKSFSPLSVPTVSSASRHEGLLTRRISGRGSRLGLPGRDNLGAKRRIEFKRDESLFWLKKSRHLGGRTGRTVAEGTSHEPDL